LISFVINLFVVAVFAQTFFGHPDAGDIGLYNSADALEKAYDSAAVKYIWAIGTFFCIPEQEQEGDDKNEARWRVERRRE
jgi:hypothetical protein